MRLAGGWRRVEEKKVDDGRHLYQRKRIKGVTEAEAQYREVI